MLEVWLDENKSTVQSHFVDNCDALSPRVTVECGADGLHLCSSFHQCMLPLSDSISDSTLY